MVAASFAVPATKRQQSPVLLAATGPRSISSSSRSPSGSRNDQTVPGSLLTPNLYNWPLLFLKICHEE